jgi:hypothetical protein
MRSSGLGKGLSGYSLQSAPIKIEKEYSKPEKVKEDKDAFHMSAEDAERYHKLKQVGSQDKNVGKALMARASTRTSSKAALIDALGGIAIQGLGHLKKKISGTDVAKKQFKEEIGKKKMEHDQNVAERRAMEEARKEYLENMKIRTADAKLNMVNQAAHSKAAKDARDAQLLAAKINSMNIKNKAAMSMAASKAASARAKVDSGTKLDAAQKELARSISDPQEKAKFLRDPGRYESQLKAKTTWYGKKTNKLTVDTSEEDKLNKELEEQRKLAKVRGIT